MENYLLCCYGNQRFKERKQLMDDVGTGQPQAHGNTTLNTKIQ